MINTFTFRSVAEAYETLVPYVLQNGIDQQSERGQTKFLPYTLIEITNPKLKRLSGKYPLGKKTVNDYVVKLLCGYGEEQDFIYTYYDRIANYNQNINQLNYVIEKLKENSNTRRAIMTIWDPCIDTENVDVPCLMTIHFQIINNELYMSTIMRSQDLLLAFPSNLLAFIELGEIVAKQVGCPLKRLIHYVLNLHVYIDRDRDYIGRW